MKNNITFLLILLFAYCLYSVEKNEFYTNCVDVIKGDLIVVVNLRVEQKIKLEGIDCPEIGQNLFAEAIDFSSKMVLNKKIHITKKGISKEGIIIGKVLYLDKDLGVELARNGLAYTNEAYGYNPMINLVQEKAKNKKLGVWAEENVPKISVYINESDKKYHLYTCQLVSNHRKCILLEEAFEKGYSHCLECKPPNVVEAKYTTLKKTSKYDITGPRGGEYYINSKGKKVYKKKDK